MRICVAGAEGRMGRRILELAAADEEIEVAGAFDLPEREGAEVHFGHESDNPSRISLASDATTALRDADVLIDFTAPAACVANLHTAVKSNRPAVAGTTGLSAEQQDEVALLAHQVPIVLAPNMSVGVNLLFKVAAEVAGVLGLDYNVEITDIHHNKKKDSPSGTAVRLAQAVAGALGLIYDDDLVYGRHGLAGERPVRQIGVHALRGGDVAGEHTVAFIGPGERIELTHRAHNRDNFARGALIAARFAATAEPGLYDMQDVLGLK